MRFIISIIILLPFFTCYSVPDNKKSLIVVESTQQLSTLITTKCNDTILLKQTLQTAYNIADSTSNRIHDSLISLCTRLLGNELMDANNLVDARIHYNKGIRYGLRHLSVNENIITRLYRNMALTYYYYQEYDKALIYFDSSKIINQDSNAILLKIDNQLNIAECYKFLNDFASSAKIYESTESQIKKWQSPFDLANFYYQYSSILRKLKNYNQAIEKANQGVFILKNIIPEKSKLIQDSLLLANILYQIAYIQQDLGMYKEAELYYSEALLYYRNTQDIRSQKMTLTNLGILYRVSKQYDKAQKILTKGISLFSNSNLNDKDIRLKASFYVNRSEVYLETKQYKKAINDQDSAIYFFTLYNEKPSLTATMLQARPVLLSVLTDKAKAHIALAEKGEDTEGYAKALKLMEEITELTDDIRADYISDEAKLTLSENVKPAFEKAIELCHTLFEKTKDTTYLHRAFAYAEQSRSMILYENARLETQLPDNLKAEREQLKQMESALSQKNNTDALQEYLRVKRMFREKIKSYNKNYLASIDEIRAQLLKNGQTALIEYFVGDSSIFVFTLTDKNCNLQKLPQTTDFDKQVATLREAVIKRNDTVFTKLSSQMYDEILRGGLASLSTNVNKLIIIPDGVLNYLSFEMLLSEKPTSFKNAPFLIKNYIISYGASANLLIEQSKKPLHNAAQETFVGFAPSYRNPKVKGDIYVLRTVTTRDSAYDLPGAIEEVQKIHEIVGGKTFMSADADVARFKKTAPRFKILHLAMHGLIDDNNPSNNRLLFTKNPADTLNNGELTAAELNTMTLHADLAVLSACNTGFGKLSKGEGVMSVARAFNYAGVPSTVMSLWVADDNETSGMMIDFYKNLKTGMPKDEALRQAKLNYLDRVKLDDKAAPFFWAAFVLSGNTEGVSFDRHLSVWMYAVMALALMASAFLFFKFKKNKMI